MCAVLAVEAPKIAYTYLRISSDRDGDELGVERQRAALRDDIERQGWVHGREFSDNDMSAFKGKQGKQRRATPPCSTPSAAAASAAWCVARR